MSLSFLPSGGKRSAMAPNLPGERSAFSAVWQFAPGHEVHDALHSFSLLDDSGAGQNAGDAILHDVVGISEAQLSSADADMAGRHTHDGRDEVVSQDCRQ